MEESYIVFRTYFHAHQAELALAKLQSEGIDAYLTDSNMGSFGFWGVASGGVKLHVAESNLKKSQKILAQDESKT